MRTQHTKQEINQAIARIKMLTEERAEMQFKYLSLQDEVSGKGMHGQVSYRIEAELEDAGYVLKLWDDEFSEELKQLKSTFSKYMRKDYVHNRKL
jgi:hypothetical protein